MHTDHELQGRRLSISRVIQGLGPGAFVTCVVLYTYSAYLLAIAAMAPVNFQLGEEMARWAVIVLPIPVFTSVVYFGGLICTWLRRRRVSRDR
jgi:hypothetical protein